MKTKGMVPTYSIDGSPAHSSYDLVHSWALRSSRHSLRIPTVVEKNVETSWKKFAEKSGGNLRKVMEKLIRFYWSLYFIYILFFLFLFFILQFPEKFLKKFVLWQKATIFLKLTWHSLGYGHVNFFFFFFMSEKLR